GSGAHREGNACVPNGPSCGDTGSDRNNCGGCGNRCADDEICSSGEKSRCGKGKHRQDNHCEDDQGGSGGGNGGGGKGGGGHGGGGQGGRGGGGRGGGGRGASAAWRRRGPRRGW